MKEVIGIELVTSENPEEAAETAVEQGELALKVSKKKKYEEYEISSAVDTLIRAEEIKQDSELMKVVSEALEKKKSAVGKIKSLKDLKNAAYEASKKTDDDEEPKKLGSKEEEDPKEEEE